MITVITSRGRGGIVLPMILVPIVLAAAVDALWGRYFSTGFCFGLLVNGVWCWTLGRRWTRAGRDDRCCGGSVQAWGVGYACFGALLLPAAIHTAWYGF